MFPDVIGGHCLIPNVELLLKSNEKRKEEIKEESVRREVIKVRSKVEALEKS